ncbi:MAG TPA: ribosomal protein L7/L12 [Terriglobales bacterium]|nr:ribosomal protein L7/L12 [Terriglobales bacterium]
MNDHPLPPNVLDAIQRRNLVEAIKLLREQTGLGLKEAKDLIDAHTDARAPVRSEFSPDALPPSAAAALQQGDKVEAIRLLHTETGIELKEARTVVESNAARLRPNVAVPSPGQVPRSQGRIYWLIAAAAIIVLVVYFFLQLKR